MNPKPKTSFLPYVLAVVLALPSAMALAAEEPPPAPGIAEAFFCNYNSGKDRGDLLAARDYYVRQAAKAGIAVEPAFLWTPFKGNADIDFLWMAVHENLKAFGAATDAGMTAEAMSGVNARFDSVATCQSNIGAMRTVREADISNLEPPALISAMACSVKGQMSQGDVMDMRAHINDVLGGLPSYKGVPMYSIAPITTSPQSPDVFLFTVHENVGSWANRTAELRGSNAGQSLRRHFDATMDCHPSLWFGEQIVTPPSS